MRIELRDLERRRVGRVVVEPGTRPTRVTALDAGGGAGRSGSHEAFLDWDTAIDDAGRLRRCVACGCADLFHEKAFPQVTGIIVVLAFAGAVAGTAGLVTNVPVLIAMAVVLLLDVGILIFSKRRLVCYRCRTSYHDLPIARYHKPWDRAIAERHGTTEPRSPAPVLPDRERKGTEARSQGPGRSGIPAGEGVAA